MPESVRWVFDFFLATGVTSAAVAGVVVWALREWISERISSRIKTEYAEKLETHKAQLKAQGDVELERLRSELNLAAQRRQLMFANLHQKRGEVIAEVYSALKDAVDAINDYTKAFEPAGGSSRDDRRARAAKCSNEFYQVFNRKKIFVPESAAKKLELINGEIREAFVLFALGIDGADEHGRAHLEKWRDVSKKVANLSKVAVAELERDFRELLGDEVPAIKEERIVEMRPS